MLAKFWSVRDHTDQQVIIPSSLLENEVLKADFFGACKTWENSA